MSPSSNRSTQIHVTGGRGRLATLIAEHFRARDVGVHLYSRIAGDGIRSLSELAPGGPLTSDDILLDLAWSTLPATSEQSPGLEEREDLPRLAKTLEHIAALAADSRPHYIFFSSGGAVYGNAPGRPSREDDVCQPIGRYGRAKLAGEQIVNEAASRHGLSCTILRIANPYGYPVPAGRAQGVIPHAIRCAIEGQPLTLWGDGHARKDFIHHTDFLSALAAVIARRLTGTFNLAAGESHSVREIIALVEKHTSRRILTNSTPAPAWDVHDSRLDPSRLRAATDWNPRIPLDEGVRRAVAGHL